MSKYFLIICWTITVVLIGCSKDNDKNSKNFRLKSWHDTTNNHKVEIIYDNNKVSEVLVYYGDDDLYTRNIWSYEENKITIKEYNRNIYNDAWIEEPDYRTLIFGEDNRLSQCNYENDPLVLYEKYYWDGKNLRKSERYLRDGRIFTNNFVYEDNRLISVPSNTFINYTDGKVSSIVRISTDTTTLLEFTHVGQYLTEILRPQADGFEKSELSYNSDNQPYKRVYSVESPYFSYSSATFIEYEQGSGNLDLYWLIQYGWVHEYLYPNMMPPFSQNEGFHFD